MKQIKPIETLSQVKAQVYPVVYYSKEEDLVYFGSSLAPEITIEMADSYEDTDSVSLVATKNDTVKGDFYWGHNLGNDVAVIEGGILRFLQHYEGSVTVTASTVNATASKTFAITCGEVATATTYAVKNVGIVETTPLAASSTTATVKFVGVTTYKYQWKADNIVESNETQTVTFEANTTEVQATRSGSFDWNGATVGWSVNLKASPFHNGYEYVDLGLPSGLKWATCNVGATKPEEYGKYFTWGDTVGTTNGSDLSWKLPKYTSTLNLDYDAARANMGGNWRMPTSGECQELISNTTSTWATINGVGGRIFTSKTNGNYIFIPAAGYVQAKTITSTNNIGEIWSSTFHSALTTKYAVIYRAYHLEFKTDDVDYNEADECGYGYSVRGVYK